MILYKVILLIHHYMKRKGIPTDYLKATSQNLSGRGTQNGSQMW